VTGLRIEDLSVQYGSGKHARRVVSGLNLQVGAGQVLGLVGESGSGKSTVARAMLGLVKPTSGTVSIGGQPLQGMAAKRRARLIQMVFQDPYASLNPRMNIGAIVAEALSARPELDRAGRAAEITRLLELVSLDPDVVRRIPRQLSGGQRQRVAIARALAASPKVIVADEITSALDVSVQAQVLNVLREVLQREQLSVLFISHSLAVVRYISDHIAVMHDGKIVETGATDDLLAAPQHPYTRALLAAVPTLQGEAVQDAGEAVGGCAYRTRCPVGPLVRTERTICAEVDPAANAAQRVHAASCHFAAVSPLADVVVPQVASA
jgi:peptide/nickel transport system ATP-binding protein